MTSKRKSKLVLAVWLGATVASFAFVAVYSRNCPYHDDWELVQFVTGCDPVTFDWIFGPHNEHFIPVPKAVMVVLGRLSGSFRAGAFLNVFLLSNASLLLMLAARMRRGEFRLSDIVFPACYLSWGHCENVLFTWQVQYTLTICLVSVVLACIHIWPVAKARGRAALLISLCLLLLPWCGVNGIIYTIPLAAWAAVAGWRQRFMTAAAIVSVAMAFVAFPRSFDDSQRIEEPTPSRCAMNAVAVLGTPVGAATVPGAMLPGIEWFGPSYFVSAEPFPGVLAVRTWPLWSSIVMVLLLPTAVAALRVPKGHLFFLLALVGTGLAVGFGRTVPFEVFDTGTAPIEGGPVTTRYALLVAPLVPAIYLTWESADWKRGIPVLAAIALLGWVSYVPGALAVGDDRAALLDGLAKAIDGPEPPTVVHHRFGRQQGFRDRGGVFAYWVRCLRASRPPASDAPKNQGTLKR